MLKYGSWDLPGLDYFQFKNSFKGSRDLFRFIVSGKDEGIKVYYWWGDVCFELAENVTEKDFELCEQSLFEINEYLSSEYKNTRPKS